VLGSHRITKSLLVGLTLVLAMALLSGCAQDVPPINCEDPDFKCYNDQAIKVIGVLRDSIAYWSNINQFGQLIVVVCGILAGIMLALHDQNNKGGLTKTIGIVATALVTGITGGLATFHVPERIDKLTDLIGNMADVVNDFDHQTEELIAGRNQKEIDEAFKTDEQFRKQVNDLTNKYLVSYNKLRLETWRLSGSASKSGSILPPPAPPSSSQPTQPTK